MELTAKINEIVTSLEALRPRVSQDPDSASAEFESILSSALAGSSFGDAADPGASLSGEIGEVPSWVDPGYTYDAENPRKPYMRELMEAMTGRTVEALYADPNSNWQETSKLASEMLYGVVGGGADTRDWNKIMSSFDIIKTARAETGKMYSPKVEISSIADEAGEIVEQYARLTDAQGNVLRSLSGSASQVTDALANFGVKSSSVPVNLDAQIIVPNFDQAVLGALKAFASKIETPEGLQSLEAENSMEKYKSTHDLLKEQSSLL